MNYDQIISQKIQNIKPSGIRKFFDILEEMTDAIFSDARQKLADFLIDGGRLKIQGGVFRLCERQDGGCRRLDGRPGCCGRRRCEGNPTNDERPKEELR